MRMVPTAPHRPAWWGVCAIAVTATVCGPAARPAAAAGPTYSGRTAQSRIATPRIDATIAVDGVLDEAPWADAAVLEGFSQYAPVDDRAAELATRVRVWYSPTAIHFGIEADAPPGSVRATLADRDKIDSDDHVLIFLNTFNDGRQALVFGVNPLGAQLDGTSVEGTRQTGGGFSGIAVGREPPDLNPDFVFQSRGRLTEGGFVVEVRIPFKSLRYQGTDTQDWGLHILRRVQATGYEDSWMPAKRSAASFLSQAGTLTDLRDLRRGLVLDINPVVTSKADGARQTGGAWAYDASRPEGGLNVRWGVTPNLTLNGTVNPDFSQVEADAGQFTFDPRSALFFAEKRPFFLEGSEFFATPSNLIYTRRIAEPVAAAKLTGKAAGTTLGVLAAIDDASTSVTGNDHPWFAVARVARDVGRGSKIAAIYTERRDGAASNRVVGGDTRLVFRDIYALQAQAVVSRTARDGTTESGPLWNVTASRSGRRYGFTYRVSGIDEDFRTATGFIGRGNLAQARAVNQVTFYGKEKGWWERATSDVTIDYTWPYDAFVKGRPAQDRKLHLNNNVTLRGGWGLGGSVLIETFGYDAPLYADYGLLESTPTGDVVRPFVGTPRLPNLDFVASIDTPQWRGLSASGFVLWGKDENFFEWASADIVFADMSVLWRPTQQARLDLRYQLQSFVRRTDGSTVGLRQIPRARLEYQLTRAIFLRGVLEYDDNRQDDLRDDSRTNLPIVIRNPATGAYERAYGERRRQVRGDLLFSYQPTPGTVFFAGYSGVSVDGPSRRRGELARQRDGFFMKVSYLFRL